MSSIGLASVLVAAWSAGAAPMGHVVAWGDSSSPVMKQFPDSLAAPRWIHACGDRSMAYKANRKLSWWGSKSLDTRYSPVGQMALRTVACSEELSLGLTDSGTVIHWGPAPTMGDPTPPSGLKDVVQIGAGFFHAVALRKGGDVVAWGANLDSVVAKTHGRTGIRSLAAGATQTVLLRTDGTVQVAGGKLTKVDQVPAGLDGVVAVASGGRHVLALKADGQVVAWGDTAGAKWAVPAGLDSVTAIAAGGFHSLALRHDGSVVCWGQNTKGQCNVPSEAKQVVAIAAGLDHSLALRRDGKVIAWGADALGQATVPFKVRTVESIHMGRDAAAAILPDGSMVAWGSLSLVPAPSLPAGRRWKSVSFGSTPHALALDDQGKPYAWGSNAMSVSTVPDTLGAAVQVEATRAVSAVLTPKGRLVAWGEDNDGLVTVAATQDSIVQFDASEYRMVALRADSTVHTWGKMVYPTLDTVPSATMGSIAVAAGDQSFLALKPDGKVLAWNPRPALAAWHLPPAGLDSVRQIAAGSVHALALRADGKVVCWGDTTRKRCDVPAGLGPVSKVLAGEAASLALVAMEPVDPPPPVGIATSRILPAPRFLSEDGALRFAGDRRVTVSVFTLDGRAVVHTRRLEPGERMGASWPHGVYLVRVHGEGHAFRWVRTGR